MQVQFSTKELELIAFATWKQALVLKDEHKRLLSLKGSSLNRSSSEYLLAISRIGHEINEHRDIVTKIEDIIYKFHNQIK